MSEFSGFDFAAGTVRGLRAFRVDDLGRLTGYTYLDPWRPGENVAKCGGATGRKRDLMTLAAAYLYGTSGGGLTVPSTYTTRPSPLSKDGEVTEHDMAKCQCGFYAYFDGSNDYANEGTVAAVVEGYGKTVLGTRGFRSDKARIVALALPKDEAPPLHVRVGLKIPESIRAIVASLSFGVATALVATGLIVQPPLPVLAIIPVVVALLALFIRGIWRADFDGFERNSRASVPKHLLDKVRRNYPDVPVFDSVKAMVRAFPPDKGVEPSPETDPQFWTRTVTR